jgi:hypothetical protein
MSCLGHLAGHATTRKHYLFKKCSITISVYQIVSSDSQANRQSAIPSQKVLHFPRHTSLGAIHRHIGPSGPESIGDPAGGSQGGGQLKDGQHGAGFISCTGYLKLNQ